MKNANLRALAQHLGSFCEENCQISGYQIDSRKIDPHDLFFALPGQKADGHLFLPEAASRGAAAAVVSLGYSGPSFGLTLIRVEEVLSSLQELARHSLALSPLPIIGITGSVGKTTTKDFVATLLEGKFRVGKNVASYNTRLTFPLSILNRDNALDLLILEMGMSDPGDIERLLSIAPPDIALITKISLAHAAQFPGGVEEIARGKGAIFSHPKTRLALFDHALHPFFSSFPNIQGTKITFSLSHREADFFLFPYEKRFVVDEKGVRAHQLDLPFQQSHFLHDFLAAAALARQMKMEWEEIDRQIPKLQLPKMRFERFEKGGIVFINDAYNASPESMRAALENLPMPKEGGKRIAVLGTMKELGPFSESSHREIGRLAQKYIDHLLVLGEETAPLCEAFTEVKKPGESFANHQSLTQRLGALMSPGDVVLVKGSRSMEMERVFELLG